MCKENPIYRYSNNYFAVKRHFSRNESKINMSEISLKNCWLFGASTRPECDRHISFDHWCWLTNKNSFKRGLEVCVRRWGVVKRSSARVAIRRSVIPQRILSDQKRISAHAKCMERVANPSGIMWEEDDFQNILKLA